MRKDGETSYHGRPILIFFPQDLRLYYFCCVSFSGGGKRGRDGENSDTKWKCS